jgi:hypothetical protein
VGRLDSVDEFASLDRAAWSATAVKACELAVDESGLEEETAVAALHRVKAGQADRVDAASMRELSRNLDETAWAAQEAGDDGRYDSLFRKSRAASALAFALSDEPDEAIYEAAYAVGTPQDLIARLGT